ncbi:SURF1 family protein [Nocardioides sp. Kera G14]|uniref:SURF1 family cytochrome oxidase biogenesis protein n=1 Tax=Nocardioides sp. Kera G14 TaxID=2884264 RepID=UPI001D1099CC|nr:SURF1 family protein [Nocardioides sp. Kera G14]UDY25135.1 SURF1 family protein [Nocardioides sp. Kera G14]
MAGRSRISFVASRRWALFFLAVIVVAIGTYYLGRWQFHRLADRKADNNIVRANEQRTPVPIDQVLSPGQHAPKKDEWLLVTATGTYDTAHTVTWRYRNSDQYDEAGIDVVVPLVTADGTAVVVDRGFVPTDGNNALAKAPAPPSGTVTVTGYVRLDGTGDSTAVDESLGTRSLSSSTVAKATGHTTYGGWLQLKHEDPTPATAPALYELPDLGNGPHFFYGIQWWFFGLLAIFGFGYLMWDEYRTQEDDDSEEAVRRREARTDAEREKAAKIEKKRALKAAYQQAYEREKSDRT